MMKLFLDIDGVMVPAKGYKLPDSLRDGFPAFSSKAIAALNHLISRYSPTIILTTSHKSNYSIESWKQLFANRGIITDKLERLPANTGNLTRKQELCNWFSINPLPASFIILDDDKSLNALPEHLKQHLILISPYVGLTEDHILAVEELLHKKAVA